MSERCSKYLKTVKCNNYLWQYKSIGSSKSIVYIAFHGFGQDLNFLDFLEGDISANNIRIIVISLLYHQSSLEKKTGLRFVSRTISIADISDGVSSICLLEGINHYGIIGYSLGARIALNLLSCDNKAIVSNVILFAPDGFHRNKWYYFLTSQPGRVLFKYIVEHDNLIATTYQLLNKAGIIGQTEKKIMNYALSEDHLLRQVYNTWSIYRMIRIDQQLLHSIKENDNLYFVFGEYDKVITQKSRNRVKKRFLNSRIELWKSGHEILSERNGEAIIKLLKQND